MRISALVLLGSLLASPAFSASYDKDYIGDVTRYEAAYEDTFVHLARDYNLGFVEMRAANPYVDPWVPGKGTDLILPTRHILPDASREGIVINLAEMRLYVYPKDGGAPESHALGIGREGLETPLGTTKVVRKKDGPIWYPTPRMRKEDPSLPQFVAQGPENPMGTHAIYLGWPTYAIHGTNRPFGIGRRISSGCIRMYPEAISHLFEIVEVGTPVTVVDQPIKAGWIDDKLYVQAYPGQLQAVEVEETGVVSESELSDADMGRILKTAGEYADRIDWPKVRQLVRERRGIPVAVADRNENRGHAEIVEPAEQVAMVVVEPEAEDVAALEPASGSENDAAGEAKKVSIRWND